LYEKEAGKLFPPPVEIISSLLLEKRPGVHDKFHNLDRRDVLDEVSCIVDMRLSVAGSGDDAIAFYPGEHAKHVVLVTLP
jgi:hypothetical protein